MSDFVYVTSTGVILVDTSTTLTEVQDEYKIAFDDADLVVNAGPLSVLINAEAESRDAIARNNAKIANQINPNEAGGTFLDSLYSLFNGQRNSGERTTVTATLGGVPTTAIPQGSAAESAEGDRFISTGAAVIGVGGTVDITFQSDEIGAIPLGAGDLNKILDSVIGWETITNAGAGDVGELIESDADAQNRRNGFLGAQSTSMSESTIASVNGVADVKSVSYRENVEPTAEIIDGVNMLANSIFVCVDGGLDSDIFQALLDSKSGGCDWTGSVEDNSFVDPISGQTYTIRFERPTEIPLDIEVTISPDSALVDPIQLAKDAVIAYANGEVEDFAGFILGANAEPFTINDGVNAFNESLNAKKIQVRDQGVPPFSTSDIVISIFEKATIVDANISVIVQ